MPVYSISIAQINECDIKDLKVLWLALEKQSSQSIFLSWAWIGLWLIQVIKCKKCFLIKAHDENENIRGLGIFTETTSIFSTYKKWFLHKTGETKFDQIWIEYNDFLLCDSNPSSIRNKMWEFAHLTTEFKVNKWVLGVSEENTCSNLCLTSNINKTIYSEDIGYSISKNDIEDIGSYPREISKSTSKKIEKTLKLLSELGVVEFKLITNGEKVLDVIENTKHWHIKKWKKTETPSGFDNSNFREFHTQLIISENTAAMTISINDEIVGVNYYLKSHKNLMFYLSCLKPFQDNKIKLGLLLHQQAVKTCFTAGFESYDFLAGDAVYKSKLASRKKYFNELQFEKKDVFFLTIKIARKLKRYFKKRAE